MLRTSVIVLIAGAVFAQEPGDVFNKPPAKVDRALRARIDEFYQDHVTQQFRKADALVAADTKEFFYVQNKPAYLKCETSRIEYSDNFTKAKATILCEQYIMAPGFADKPVKVPIPSRWKLEKGKWCWYVDQNALRQTPFGKMSPGPGAPTGTLPSSIPDDTSFVMRLVKADKEIVELKPGQSEQVILTNSAPGNMDLTLVGAIPGIEAKLDHSQMKVGDRAILTLKAGDKPEAGALTVRVEQTGLAIAIQVVVLQP